MLTSIFTDVMDERDVTFISSQNPVIKFTVTVTNHSRRTYAYDAINIPGGRSTLHCFTASEESTVNSRTNRVDDNGKPQPLKRNNCVITLYYQSFSPRRRVNFAFQSPRKANYKSSGSNHRQPCRSRDNPASIVFLRNVGDPVVFKNG